MVTPDCQVVAVGSRSTDSARRSPTGSASPWRIAATKVWGLLLTEAMWTRCQPGWLSLVEELRAGGIRADLAGGSLPRVAPV